MTTLLMVRADTAEFDVLVTHPVTGDPVDINDAAITMTAAPSYDAADHTFKLTSVAGDIVPTPDETGRALVNVPATATEELENQLTRLFFDVTVEMTSPDERWTVDRGMLLVQPNVPESAP